MTTEIAIAEISLKDRALTELKKVDAGIADLKAKYVGKVYDCTNALGMAQAKAARVAVREVRYKVPKIAESVTKQLNDLKKDIKDEAERIIGELFEIENVSHSQIDAEEKRKDAEKAEKAALAAAAQKILDDKIIEIGKLPLRCIGQTSDEITLFIAALDAKPIGGEFTGDTRKRAEDAKEEAVTAIRGMLAATIQAEEIAATLKAEQEAETARLEAERVEREAAEKIRREEMEKEQAAFAEEKRKHDLEQAEIKKQRDEEAAKFAAEKAAFETEQAKIKAERDRADRIASEKQSLIDAENKRIADEAAAAQRGVERQAAIVAEAARKKAETERKAAEKKAKLLAAKCADASTAFLKILDICNGNGPGNELEEIATICEAMLL